MKKHKKLSIDELRSFPGFENVGDEEAEQVIKTLENLSVLYYELFMKEKNENVEHLKKGDSHETDHGHAA